MIEELYNYIDNVFVYSKDIDSKILESEKSKLKIYIKNNIENLSDLSFDTLTKEIDKKLTYLLDKEKSKEENKDPNHILYTGMDGIDKEIGKSLLLKKSVIDPSKILEISYCTIGNNSLHLHCGLSRKKISLIQSDGTIRETNEFAEMLRKIKKYISDNFEKYGISESEKYNDEILKKKCTELFIIPYVHETLKQALTLCEKYTNITMIKLETNDGFFKLIQPALVELGMTIENKFESSRLEALSSQFPEYINPDTNQFNIEEFYKNEPDRANSIYISSELLKINLQKIEENRLSDKSIQMNTQLESMMSELVETSLLSSEQAMQKYIQQPEYQEHMKQVQEQRTILLSRIQDIRKNNPTMSDGDFYKQMMVSFLASVVSQIQTQYGQVLPPEKLAKINGLLNPENITFTNDKNQNDIQADSLTGRLIINPQKTGGSTLEEKIVSSMGASIHESFHLMVNMLKNPEQAEQLGERLMYKVATSEGEKEVHFAPGKYGQVLSEGFVEKLSSEFAQKNGFYYTLNPSYIPCVKLCGEFMRQDSTIDESFLFTKSGDDIVSKMSSDVKSKFEESERLFVFNTFEAKEVKKDESLKGISSENVVSSWVERKNKVEEVKQNETFKKPFEIKKQEVVEQQAIQESKKEPEFTTFKKKKEERQIQQQNINVMSQPKKETHEQQKQVTAQHNQTKQMEKPKVKTLTKPTNNSGGSSKGFVDTLILTLITGFVAGALFMIAYYIFN